MGRFLEALQQRDSALHLEASVAGSGVGTRPGLAPVKIAPLPSLQSVPTDLARQGAINRLSEQLAALTAVREPVRILIAGCRPGDGTSTLTAGIAIDMSQRLGLSTILVDAHLRHPTLHHLMLRSETSAASGSGGLSTKARSTTWPRLDLASAAAAPDVRTLAAEFDSLLEGYSLAIIDLGVVRLDPTVLSFARPGDPVLLCARYGHTERRELSTSVQVLSAANRPVTGVIFNGVRSSIPNFVRRILAIGG
jgi:tyrosine-protein kinase